jgi:hypothetical protein
MSSWVIAAARAGHQFVYLERAVGWQTIAKRQSELLRDAEAAGAAATRTLAASPRDAPHLELARFSQVGGGRPSRDG